MKKLGIFCMLLLVTGVAAMAQDVGLFADIDAVALTGEEMELVVGGLPGRTTMTIDGDGVGYLNAWEANLNSGYNGGDDYYPAATASERRAGLKRLVRATRWVANVIDNLFQMAEDLLE